MPHGNWGSAGACSVFMVKRTLRRSVLQEQSCTESLWVWQLPFLLCAATWKENLLCLLMFILILHVFTTHRRKWQIEKIFVFTKAKRLLQQAARQTQCKCQSLSFSILCVPDHFYLPKEQQEIQAICCHNQCSVSAQGLLVASHCRFLEHHPKGRLKSSATFHLATPTESKQIEKWPACNTLRHTAENNSEIAAYVQCRKIYFWSLSLNSRGK